MDKNKKTTYIVAAASLLIIIVAIYFLFIRSNKGEDLNQAEGTNIVKDIAEIPLDKRPYVTLTPTSDGAEIIMSIENMGEFENIEYELTYLADNPQVSGEKVQRGATGVDVNTKDEKYKKSILLGTASRGTRSPDIGVVEGKLTLHAIKGDTEYLSETHWDIFEAGEKAQTISARNGNFEMALPSLGKNYWIIIADTIGYPKNNNLNSDKVVLPVWGTFSIAPEFTQATIKIKISGQKEKIEVNKLAHQDNTWQKLASDFDSQAQTVNAKVESFATFVVSSQ